MQGRRLSPERKSTGRGCAVKFASPRWPLNRHGLTGAIQSFIINYFNKARSHFSRTHFKLNSAAVFTERQSLCMMAPVSEPWLKLSRTYSTASVLVLRMLGFRGSILKYMKPRFKSDGGYLFPVNGTNRMSEKFRFRARSWLSTPSFRGVIRP